MSLRNEIKENPTFFLFLAMTAIGAIFNLQDFLNRYSVVVIPIFICSAVHEIKEHIEDLFIKNSEHLYGKEVK
jgi:hypothetical protein